jgi:hypothetical protein
MATPAGDAATCLAPTGLPERQRERGLDRYKGLRPHLEEDASLAGVAKEAPLPLRAAQRWVSQYRWLGYSGWFALAGRTRANPPRAKRVTPPR